MARATEIAREMVTRYGMDEALGYVTLEGDELDRLTADLELPAPVEAPPVKASDRPRPVPIPDR